MAHHHQSPPRVVTLSEVEEVVSSDGFAARLVDAILDGFVSFSRGDFNAPPIQTMGAPPMSPFGSSSSLSDGGDYSAQTCVKSGYLSSSSHYVVKVASGGRPFPSNSGNVQLYSQSTGALVAIFLDDGLLTELRTAAAGAAAARLLSPDLSIDLCVGMVGTGTQARHQLRYLRCVTECRNVVVWGRTKINVEGFVDDMTTEGWNVRSVEDVDDLLDACGLIVTTTSSRMPLLGRGWLGRADARGRRDNDDIGRPLHVTCVGSDSIGKKELDDVFVSSADMLVADSRLQTAERGEFQDVVRSGMVGIDDVVEIGELANRKALHRGRGIAVDRKNEDRRLTIFDSSGVAVQDCVIASMVYEALRR